MLAKRAEGLRPTARMDWTTGLHSVDLAIGNLETAPVSIRRLRAVFGRIDFLGGTGQRQGRDRPFVLESGGSLGYDSRLSFDNWKMSVLGYR